MGRTPLSKILVNDSQNCLKFYNWTTNFQAYMTLLTLGFGSPEKRGKKRQMGFQNLISVLFPLDRRGLCRRLGIISLFSVVKCRCAFCLVCALRFHRSYGLPSAKKNPKTQTGNNFTWIFTFQFPFILIFVREIDCYNNALPEKEF